MTQGDLMMTISPTPHLPENTSFPIPFLRSALCSASQEEFDVNQHINLLSMFREGELETYFPVFERIVIILAKECVIVTFSAKFVQIRHLSVDYGSGSQPGPPFLKH